MADDQGKEEEKFDFTGEGESVGYISLEQAGVLAMRTARETPGEYGSIGNQQKWDTLVKERSGRNGSVVGLPEQVVVALSSG